MPYETARTTLRDYRDADVEQVLALWNDPEVQALAFFDYSGPRDRKFVEHVRASAGTKSGFAAIVEDRASGAFLGELAFSVVFAKTRVGELSIALAREHWGKGYGTELMAWLVQFGFSEWGLHRIQLGVSERNERAVALYKYIGFVQEGLKRDYLWSHGRYWGRIDMGILASEWDTEKGAKKEKSDA